ncbi:MAG: hypothetical protein WCK55_18185 [Verrucomicrobiota bacterium]
MKSWFSQHESLSILCTSQIIPINKLLYFRNIRILELPPGIATPEQIAPVVEK